MNPLEPVRRLVTVATAPLIRLWRGRPEHAYQPQLWLETDQDDDT